MSPTPFAVMLIVAGLAGGVLLLGTVTTGAATIVAPPTFDAAAFRPVTVMSELAEGKPLRLAISGSLADLKPGTHKLFFADQAMYHGALNDDVVGEVIGRGRAETLEHRLAPEAQERLRALLAEFDQALRDVSLVINEEEERVKGELVKRPDRVVRIMTMPRERDPAFHDLRAARGLVSNGRGVVWGVAARAGDTTETYVVVKWEEWPGLKAMEDDRIYMLTDRDQRVRAWIEQEYRVHGTSLFAGTLGTAAARSPAAVRPTDRLSETR